MRCDSCFDMAHRLHILESGDRICDQCAKEVREWFPDEFTGETE